MSQLDRPLLYSQVLADLICERVAAGEGLRSICACAGLPARGTVRMWLRDEAGFAQAFALAREELAEALAGEIIEIADGVDGSISSEVQKAKLMIDARKWYVGKVAPQRFGDGAQAPGEGDLPSAEQQGGEPLDAGEAYKRLLGRV